MNHPLRVVLLCTLMTMLQTGWSQSAEMSMDQLIDYALANSPEMLDAQLKIQDAEAQILQSKSTGLPQLSGTGTYQRYFKVPIVPLPPEFTGGGEPQEVSFVLKNNLTGGVNLDAMIFDAAYFVALRAARAARTYAQLELVDRQRQVRQQVREVYLPVLLLQSNLLQLEKNLNNLEALYQETKEIYEAGFAEQLDVDRLALSLANLRTERDALDRQYQNALRALKFTINYPAGQELTIADDMEAMLADSPEMLNTTINYNRRPEINLLDKAIELNDYNIQNFKTRYLPSLRGFGGYQYQYQGNDFQNGFWAPTGFVGLTLNVPIYDGGFKRSQIDRATISRQQVQVQRSTVQRLIDLEVENAQTTYQSAQERLTDRENNLALAQRIYDTTQVKYREGVGSSLEVNQAEQALYTAQTNRLQAIYDVLQAKIALEEALGLN